MSQEVADYFNRFYNILLREHLQDPTIHSEWLYFLSMFKSDPLDQGRIDLYLNILVSENKKKAENKQTDSVVSLGSESTPRLMVDRQKSKCNRQASGTISELKMQKKMSQNIKNPYSQNFQFKVGALPLQMRKISSAEEDPPRPQRQSLTNDSKNCRDKQKDEPFYGVQLLQSPNLNQYLANLGMNQLRSEIKEEKETKQARLAERQRRLREISSRVVKEFETNAKLRA